MPQPTDLLSYRAQIDVLQRALAAERGISLSFPTAAEAFQAKMRLYAARKADARENKKVYPSDHEMHGRSFFSELMIRQSGSTLEIHKVSSLLPEIQDL